MNLLFGIAFLITYARPRQILPPVQPRISESNLPVSLPESLDSRDSASNWQSAIVGNWSLVVVPPPAARATSFDGFGPELTQDGPDPAGRHLQPLCDAASPQLGLISQHRFDLSFHFQAIHISGRKMGNLP